MSKTTRKIFARWMSVTLCLGLFAAACAQSAPAPATSPSILSVLDRFTAPSVPASGPSEVMIPHIWPKLPATMPTWPGNGLSQHPFLIGGEGSNIIQLVAGGKVVWTYSAPRGEIDDAWLLSNGNVLFTCQYHVIEVTPQKKVVWQYDVPAGRECHSVQPIGLDKALIVEEGVPPRVFLINKLTNAIEMSHDLPAPPATDAKTIHAQSRHVRLTQAGTYLVPLLNLNKVVEYDKNWNQIFSVDEPEPWAAIRLKSGNILISGNVQGWVREVDRTGKVVWEIDKNDLPGITIHIVDEVDRLSNDDTIICSNGTGKKTEGPPNYQTSVQLVEVTPDKKIVWVLQDWDTVVPCSWVQLLDEPGVPEDGDLGR